MKPAVTATMNLNGIKPPAAGRHCQQPPGKDYRQAGKTKVMTLAADEFIRRFLQHAAPGGFHRIRHFGFLANRHCAEKLALCRALLAAPQPEPPSARCWQDRLRRWRRLGR
jgi:Putative transposase